MCYLAGYQSDNQCNKQLYNVALTINSFGLVGVTCPVTCSEANFFFSSFQEFFFMFFVLPAVATSSWYEERTHACCALPVQLATPPGFQVNPNPEGEPSYNVLVRGIDYIR